MGLLIDALPLYLGSPSGSRQLVPLAAARQLVAGKDPPRVTYVPVGMREVRDDPPHPLITESMPAPAPKSAVAHASIQFQHLPKPMGLYAQA